MGLKDRFAAAIGRPRAIEGEKMVVADGLMASMVRPIKGGVYFLPVDEIVQRQGYKVYSDMKFDDMVKTCLAFKRILVAGRAWEIKPADDSAQAKEIAAFVEWCLEKINFNDVATEALSGLEYGYALAEKVFERTTYEGKQVVCLKKLAFRDPVTISLRMDNHGNWEGARQLANGGPFDLGPEKLWLWTYNGRFGNLYGESDLRAAYRSWWAKKFIINFWNVYLERMGAPMTMMKYPHGASDELKTTLKTILQNLGSKTEILVPEGVEINLVEATRAGSPTYEKALNFHDQAIARALLMASMFGTGGESNQTRGSDSQSSLQLRVLFKMADGISQHLTASFMDQVVKQLVEFNYDNADLMPEFVWQDYGQFEGMKVADTIRLLFAAGILDLDQADVNYCRSVLGLPLRDEDDPPDEVQRPPPPPPPGNPNAPPPAAGQGNERAKKGGDTSTKNSELRVKFFHDG